MVAPRQVAGSTQEGGESLAGSPQCGEDPQRFRASSRRPPRPSPGFPQPEGRGNQGGSCEPKARRMGAHPPPPAGVVCDDPHLFRKPLVARGPNARAPALSVARRRVALGVSPRQATRRVCRQRHRVQSRVLTADVPDGSPLRKALLAKCAVRLRRRAWVGGLEGARERGCCAARTSTCCGLRTLGALSLRRSLHGCER
jgi:hypothetical protein